MPPATFDHVIWIWMENHSYFQVVGAKGSAAYTNSPYLNGTVATQCGLATNYHNVTRSSLPNYLSAAAGTSPLTKSCTPAGCPQAAVNIFGQLDESPGRWGAYDESMPSNCSSAKTALYGAGHNPAVYYSDVRATCHSRDVPMGTTTSGAFVNALRTGTLPAFSFVTPNYCNDEHSCSLRTGDSWLARWLSVITASSAYQTGNTAVFITWDEGARAFTSACANNATDPGCHVATFVLSPYTRPGTRSSVMVNHYGLLKTTEELLDLPLLGHAADPGTNDMLSAFHL